MEERLQFYISQLNKLLKKEKGAAKGSYYVEKEDYQSLFYYTIKVEKELEKSSLDPDEKATLREDLKRIREMFEGMVKK